MENVTNYGMKNCVLYLPQIRQPYLYYVYNYSMLYCYSIGIHLPVFSIVTATSRPPIALQYWILFLHQTRFVQNDVPTYTIGV